MNRILFLGAVAAGLLLADSKNQVFGDFTTPLPLAGGSTLVVGVVGGWERWDAEQRIIRRIALRLRERKLPGVWVETVENHKLALGEELIRKAFPAPADARLVVYGQSLGGPAAVQLARRLHEAGYGVRRLVVIDCIGGGDPVIPPNVGSALNLFQRDSWWPVVGAKRIRAEDAARTEILGNQQFRYRGKRIEMPGEPWIRRTFMRGHLKMEYDPAVWQLVEERVAEAIEAAGARRLK